MYIFDLGKLEKDWNCRSIMERLPLKRSPIKLTKNKELVGLLK